MWWGKYVGIPFKEKGRAGDGLDCWGLVRMVYAEQLGIDLPDYLECYETTCDREPLANTISIERENGWEAPAKPVPYDVIIVRMRGVPMHVGVVTRPGFMLHTAIGIGTVHERFDSVRWRDKIEGFARHQGLCQPPAVQQ